MHCCCCYYFPVPILCYFCSSMLCMVNCIKQYHQVFTIFDVHKFYENERETNCISCIWDLPKNSQPSSKWFIHLNFIVGRQYTIYGKNYFTNSDKKKLLIFHLQNDLKQIEIKTVGIDETWQFIDHKCRSRNKSYTHICKLFRSMNSIVNFQDIIIACAYFAHKS